MKHVIGMSTTPAPPFADPAEALLREAFAGLDLPELCEYEAELAEGSGHRGHSALIGLSARHPLTPGALGGDD